MFEVKNTKNQQAGLSILSVLVGFALLGLVALGAATVLENNFRSKAKAKQFIKAFQVYKYVAQLDCCQTMAPVLPLIGIAPSCSVLESGGDLFATSGIFKHPTDVNKVSFVPKDSAGNNMFELVTALAKETDDYGLRVEGSTGASKWYLSLRCHESSSGVRSLVPKLYSKVKNLETGVSLNTPVEQVDMFLCGGVFQDPSRCI